MEFGLEKEGSMSDTEQLGGKGVERDRGDAKAQPSGPRGDNPAAAGLGETEATPGTVGSGEGLDPSAPGETGTTPGSHAK